VCCSVLQCVQMSRNLYDKPRTTEHATRATPRGIFILLHAATHYVALQNTATHCATLQRTATHCDALQRTATHCNTLQHTTAYCNTLQHTATHCHTLQHTATHCNALTRCHSLLHNTAHCDTLHHCTGRWWNPRVWEGSGRLVQQTKSAAVYCVAVLKLPSKP